MLADEARAVDTPPWPAVCPSFEIIRALPPSIRHIKPNLAVQMRVAFSNNFWKTGSNSPGELETTRSTSAVAVCRSSASASSRARAVTCCCRSARVELAWRAAVGVLLRLGFVVLPCCVFAGLRVIVRRRLTEPLPWADEHTLPRHEVGCAPQQNSLSIGSYGSCAPDR